MGTSEESQALEPVLSLRFKEPNIVPVAVDYNELQRAVMPVVGFANGQVEPFASAFCVSVSMSLVLTAWHVLEDFVRDHAASLAAGTSHIAVVFETAEQLADGTYLGGPLPVFSASHIIGTDLAVLRLCDVYSGTELVQPTRLAGISFSPPPQDDYCYAFGYPHLVGGAVKRETARSVVDFERTLHASGGRIWDVHPAGIDAESRIPRWAPYFDCDAPTPFGMSGGPVMTDAAGLCGLVSTSYDPFEPDDRWSSNVSLLAPLLGCPITCQDRSGSIVDATFYDLALDGNIDIHGDLPARPPTAQVETIQFPVPLNLG